ncbi:MAG TPA: NAD(P)/FAD-dependent oxidoreductase, partial [Sphingomicrobium sp.]|nr:NAD(P)/FAD-dependent oxidoreductase [Sphingomicrobium sp.]
KERHSRVSSVRDLVIIGGGAAGIGAARQAHAQGVEPLIVEAKDRLGGRAYTIEWNGFRLDLGCTWMHSAERNSLRVEAERLGAKIDRRGTNWFGQYRDLGWSRADQDEAFAAFEQLENRMNEDAPQSDRAADALVPNGKWNQWLEAICGYINGAPLANVSVEDWLAYDNASSAQNLRLADGYGHLLCSLGKKFDHRLNTCVTAISRRTQRVELETSSGVIEAKRVIVTVPTSTLWRIRFDPPIDEVLDAAEHLPLGLANKLFLALSEPEEFPFDAHLVGNPHSSETGSYFLRPMGIPVVEGFFGGNGARTLEELGEKGAAAFAIDELAALLGSSFRKRVQALQMSSWGHEPFIEGSYSHACPGFAAARELLANAGDDRIVFAGEAVSRTDYSTAHGAYDSGIRAVRKLLATTLAAREPQ